MKKSKKPRIMPRFGAQTMGPMGKASIGKRIPGQCFGFEISYGTLRTQGRGAAGGHNDI